MIQEVASNNETKEINEKPLEGFRLIKPELEMDTKALNEAVNAEFNNASIDSVFDDNSFEDSVKTTNIEDMPFNKNETMSEIESIKTRNDALENQRHPETDVLFVRKTVELPGGKKIEGVFPVFKSEFDAKISSDKYLNSDKEQFIECNKQLYNAIEANPELKEKFSPDQIAQIKDGIQDGSAPDGYVWNHNEEPGKLQLVDANTHAKTGHTGGRALWGGGSEFR